MTQKIVSAAQPATARYKADDLGLHEMAITATVPMCRPGQGLSRAAIREFAARPKGLRELTT